MTKEEIINEIEKNGCFKVLIDDDFITVTTPDSTAKVVFDRKTENYTVDGFGSPLSFTTYPIYKIWRKLILKVQYGEEEKDND